MDFASGRGAAWLARLTGGQKAAGSNPVAPTILLFLQSFHLIGEGSFFIHFYFTGNWIGICATKGLGRNS